MVDNTFGQRLGGLLGNPNFNQGVGLLAGVLGKPTSVGEAVQPGITLGQAAGRNQIQRERLLGVQRKRQAQEKLKGLLAGDGPPDQKQLLGLLADVAPDEFARGLLGQAFPKPQQATSFQRDLNFLVNEKKVPFQTALEMLKRGTTVNVGQEKTLSVSDAARMTDDSGNPPPPGITIGDALKGGFRVKPRQQSAAEEKQQTQTAIASDTLDRLAKVVTGDKIQTGFISEGGITQFLATPFGQVATGIVSLADPETGKELELTPAQSDALSLQESLSNQLLAAMRGAAVGPAEQERFEQQLPRLTQPPNVFAANVKNTRRNLDAIAKRLEASRTGRSSKPQSKTSRKRRLKFDAQGNPVK